MREPEHPPVRVRKTALHRLVGNRLYRHTLTGRVPADLLTGVGQAWPGDDLSLIHI